MDDIVGGFVFLPEFFDSDALDSVRLDVEGMIDDLAARLHKAGKIRDLYAGHDWTSRLLRMRADFPDAPVVLIKGGVLHPLLLLGLVVLLRGKAKREEQALVRHYPDYAAYQQRVPAFFPGF